MPLGSDCFFFFFNWGQTQIYWGRVLGRKNVVGKGNEKEEKAWMSLSVMLSLCPRGSGGHEDD